MSLESFPYNDVDIEIQGPVHRPRSLAFQPIPAICKCFAPWPPRKLYSLDMLKKSPQFKAFKTATVVAVLVGIGLYWALVYTSRSDGNSPLIIGTAHKSSERKEELSQGVARWWSRNNPKSRRDVDPYVRDEMIKVPFSGNGINSHAKDYYGFSEADAGEIAEIATSVRLTIAQKVVDGLIMPEQSEDGLLWIYLPPDGLYEEMRQNLVKRLSRVGGQDFAELSAQALLNDSSFLGGGKNTIRIYRETAAGGSPEPMVRVDQFAKEGGLIGSWSGSYEAAKDTLWLDLQEPID